MYEFFSPCAVSPSEDILIELKAKGFFLGICDFSLPKFSAFQILVQKFIYEIIIKFNIL